MCRKAVNQSIKRIITCICACIRTVRFSYLRDCKFNSFAHPHMAQIDLSGLTCRLTPINLSTLELNLFWCEIVCVTASIRLVAVWHMVVSLLATQLFERYLWPTVVWRFKLQFVINSMSFFTFFAFYYLAYSWHEETGVGYQAVADSGLLKGGVWLNGGGQTVAYRPRTAIGRLVAIPPSCL